MAGGHGLPLQLLNKNVPTVSVSNFRDIVFYGCSEIILTRNFTIFTVYATISGQFMAVFHFLQLHKGNRSLYVGPPKKVRYLTLDLLKSFSQSTIRKKITMNEFRHLIIGRILDLLEKSSKTREASYKWFTTLSMLDLLKIFSEVIVFSNVVHQQGLKNGLCHKKWTY